MNKTNSDACTKTKINWGKLIALFVVFVIVQAAFILKYIFIRYAAHPYYPLKQYHYVLLVVLLIADIVLVYLMGLRDSKKNKDL